MLFRTRYGRGQKSLFNILRAFANYDSEIGYCQGMANIGALLLIHFKEEEAFWMLCHLMTDLSLGEFYAPGFPLLVKSFRIHDCLLERHLPELYRHFREHDLKCPNYLTKWLMNVYICFPFHTSLYIWDLFVLFGIDILHCVAIGILSYLQKRLFNMGFEDMMKLLTETHRLELDDERLARHTRKIYKKHKSGSMNDLAKLCESQSHV